MDHDERDEGTAIDIDADEVLYVTNERLAAATVVAAKGEIDLLTAEDLAAAVGAALASRPRTVVIDLTRAVPGVQGPIRTARGRASRR